MYSLYLYEGFLLEMNSSDPLSTKIAFYVRLTCRLYDGSSLSDPPPLPGLPKDHTFSEFFLGTLPLACWWYRTPLVCCWPRAYKWHVFVVTLSCWNVKRNGMIDEGFGMTTVYGWSGKFNTALRLEIPGQNLWLRTMITVSKWGQNKPWVSCASHFGMGLFSHFFDTILFRKKVWKV